MTRRYRDTGVGEKWVGYVITRPRLKEWDHVTEIRTEIVSDLIPNTMKALLFSPPPHRVLPYPQKAGFCILTHQCAFDPKDP